MSNIKWKNKQLLLEVTFLKIKIFFDWRYVYRNQTFNILNRNFFRTSLIPQHIKERIKKVNLRMRNWSDVTHDCNSFCRSFQITLFLWLYSGKIFSFRNGLSECNFRAFFVYKRLTFTLSLCNHFIYLNTHGFSLPSC
jgi:hypothetical protein